MIARRFMLGWALALPAVLYAQEPAVNVDPPNLQGSRPLESQTASAVVHAYMQAWQTLRSAFAQNQPSLLDQNFIGIAHSKLAETIAEQAKLGLETHYQDRSHDLQVIFYSPEGGSIELTDKVQYEEQVLANGKVLGSQPVDARYLVVLTPSEGHWMVRMFQAEPAQ
ncbi:MAG TPA: hypothetical protein VHZ09_03395 [Acidobacteriaceae bacterium]|jgi:hypothetical protein|nr:hypothetical protein [Acidobacteriaceae bacterium]